MLHCDILSSPTWPPRQMLKVVKLICSINEIGEQVHVSRVAASPVWPKQSRARPRTYTPTYDYPPYISICGWPPQRLRSSPRIMYSCKVRELRPPRSTKLDGVGFTTYFTLVSSTSPTGHEATLKRHPTDGFRKEMKNAGDNAEDCMGNLSDTDQLGNVCLVRPALQAWS
ncbi:hypothetical protein BD289DRAFT_126206 [Coniella lustricola]|uniref:Uncharacterized protein n=1 Tax=Coniella lustricola TaxID=2025994 RepID=A0A2T3AG42_9PEZI|nr:hypothetical protein BD289DRAFT_126206 [Coniella lustricola]